MFAFIIRMRYSALEKHAYMNGCNVMMCTAFNTVPFDSTMRKLFRAFFSFSPFRFFHLFHHCGRIYLGGINALLFFLLNASVLLFEVKTALRCGRNEFMQRSHLNVYPIPLFGALLQTEVLFA